MSDGERSTQRVFDVPVLKSKTLIRAAEILGGVEQLRACLGTSRIDLLAWMAGYSEPPLPAFLLAVDVVLQDSEASGPRRDSGSFGQTTQDTSNDAERLRVLVIDDNVDAAMTLCLLLREHGYEATTAYNGDTGLTLALEFRPAVVLLDLGLPNMDGFEIARSMRKNAVLKDVYIIAVTGQTSDEDLAKARAAGIDEHLAKTVDFSVIDNRIKTCAARLTALRALT